ncbi:anti-sigma factor [Allobranchiibius sp. GilTou73]|uniref:anti-sigma factor family protein n=1 Tax=Allobranchiibius sp. GilTou73 TaxID=2904523 RepID=UPI001F2BB258|nr:zf-HC2 domain-containing protein [Allobranchiibius sp. GilTou73]UIJ34746.1 zf-HC2 domain-containing protein [Allobranchiibius sp. GilTou73]
MIRVRDGQDMHDQDVLSDYVDGMLDPERTCGVERHLSVCLHCRAFVQEQREVIARMRSFTLGHQGQHDLAAGLMHMAREAHRECAPIRPQGPATLAISAPAQYASARRSVACAMFAVAGCVGAALVAVQVPVGTTGGTPGQMQRGGSSVVRQLPRASSGSGTEPVADPVVRAAMVRSGGH